MAITFPIKAVVNRSIEIQYSPRALLSSCKEAIDSYQVSQRYLADLFGPQLSSCSYRVNHYDYKKGLMKYNSVAFGCHFVVFQEEVRHVIIIIVYLFTDWSNRELSSLFKNTNWLRWELSSLF